MTAAPDGGAEGRTVRDQVLLLLILLVAAYLRFAGLTHHLARGLPEFDEKTNFVDPILRMWRAGTLDPTVIPGYPGFLNWLLFFPVLVGQRLGGEVGAYAAARGVVAAFSTLNVFLLYRLAARLLGGSYALFAAALLAVCPLEMRAAHYITADTLVGTASLGILLLLSRTGAERREEFLSGVIAGMASALKYTGLLVGAPLLLGLLVRRRLRGGLVAAGVGCVLAFALAAPYALFPARPEGTGFGTSVQAYYGTRTEENRFLGGGVKTHVLGLVRMGLGSVGCGLAAASLLLFRNRGALVPAAGMVLGLIGVLLPANLIYPRHVVPAMGAAAFLAAAGLSGLLERLPLGHTPAGLSRVVFAGPLILATLGPPLVSSVRLSERYRAVPAVEQAARWLENQARGPSCVLTSLRAIRLDPSRFEVQFVESLHDVPPSVLAQYAFVVAQNPREAEGLAVLETAAQFPAEEGGAAQPLVLRPREGASPSRHPAPPAALSSEPAAAGLEALADGRAETVWVGPERPGFVELRFGGAVTVERVEVEVGSDSRFWPQSFLLQGTPDGHTWEPLEADPVRPTRPARQIEGIPHGQVYVLLPPRSLSGLRLVREGGGPWGIAEVRVYRTREAGA